MSIETTHFTPEKLDQLVVPEAYDYVSKRRQVEQQVAGDPELLESIDDASRIIDSIEGLNRQFAERRFGDTINVGDVFYDKDSFLIRAPDGSAPEELFTIHTITNSATNKRPRRVCDVTMLLGGVERKIRIDSKNSQIEITDHPEGGEAIVLADDDKEMALFDLECRVLIAKDAAK